MAAPAVDGGGGLLEALRAGDVRRATAVLREQQHAAVQQLSILEAVFPIALSLLAESYDQHGVTGDETPYFQLARELHRFMPDAEREIPDMLCTFLYAGCKFKQPEFTEWALSLVERHPGIDLVALVSDRMYELNSLRHSAIYYVAKNGSAPLYDMLASALLLQATRRSSGGGGGGGGGGGPVGAPPAAAVSPVLLEARMYDRLVAAAVSSNARPPQPTPESVALASLPAAPPGQQPAAPSGDGGAGDDCDASAAGAGGAATVMKREEEPDPPALYMSLKAGHAAFVRHVLAGLPVRGRVRAARTLVQHGLIPLDDAPAAAALHALLAEGGVAGDDSGPLLDAAARLYVFGLGRDAPPLLLAAAGDPPAAAPAAGGRSRHSSSVSSAPPVSAAFTAGASVDEPAAGSVARGRPAQSLHSESSAAAAAAAPLGSGDGVAVGAAAAAAAARTTAASSATSAAGTPLPAPSAEGAPSYHALHFCAFVSELSAEPHLIRRPASCRYASWLCATFPAAELALAPLPRVRWAGVLPSVTEGGGDTGCDAHPDGFPGGGGGRAPSSSCWWSGWTPLMSAAAAGSLDLSQVLAAAAAAAAAAQPTTGSSSSAGVELLSQPALRLLPAGRVPNSTTAMTIRPIRVAVEAAATHRRVELAAWLATRLTPPQLEAQLYTPCRALFASRPEFVKELCKCTPALSLRALRQGTLGGGGSGAGASAGGGPRSRRSSSTYTGLSDSLAACSDAESVPVAAAGGGMGGAHDASLRTGGRGSAVAAHRRMHASLLDRPGGTVDEDAVVTHDGPPLTRQRRSATSGAESVASSCASAGSSTAVGDSQQQSPDVDAGGSAAVGVLQTGSTSRADPSRGHRRAIAAPGLSLHPSGGGTHRKQQQQQQQQQHGPQWHAPGRRARSVSEGSSPLPSQPVAAATYVADDGALVSADEATDAASHASSDAAASDTEGSEHSLEEDECHESSQGSPASRQQQPRGDGSPADAIPRQDGDTADSAAADGGDFQTIITRRSRKRAGTGPGLGRSGGTGTGGPALLPAPASGSRSAKSQRPPSAAVPSHTAATLASRTRQQQQHLGAPLTAAAAPRSPMRAPAGTLHMMPKAPPVGGGAAELVMHVPKTPERAGVGGPLTAKPQRQQPQLRAAPLEPPMASAVPSASAPPSDPDWSALAVILPPGTRAAASPSLAAAAALPHHEPLGYYSLAGDSAASSGGPEPTTAPFSAPALFPAPAPPPHGLFPSARLPLAFASASEPAAYPATAASPPLPPLGWAESQLRSSASPFSPRRGLEALPQPPPPPSPADGAVPVEIHHQLSFPAAVDDRVVVAVGATRLSQRLPGTGLLFRGRFARFAASVLPVDLLALPVPGWYPDTLAALAESADTTDTAAVAAAALHSGVGGAAQPPPPQALLLLHALRFLGDTLTSAPAAAAGGAPPPSSAAYLAFEAVDGDLWAALAVTPPHLGAPEAAAAATVDATPGSPFRRLFTGASVAAPAPPSLRQRLDWCRQIACGVAAMHAAGAVHGGLSPGAVYTKGSAALKVGPPGLLAAAGAHLLRQCASSDDDASSPSAVRALSARRRLLALLGGALQCAGPWWPMETHALLAALCARLQGSLVGGALPLQAVSDSLLPLLHHAFTPACDVFALGCVMFTCLTASSACAAVQQPHALGAAVRGGGDGGGDSHGVVAAILASHTPLHPALAGACAAGVAAPLPPAAVDLIVACLAPLPERRPSVWAVLAHPLFSPATGDF